MVGFIGTFHETLVKLAAYDGAAHGATKGASFGLEPSLGALGGFALGALPGAALMKAGRPEQLGLAAFLTALGGVGGLLGGGYFGQRLADKRRQRVMEMYERLARAGVKRKK